jgi:hypothetical protein
VGSLDGRGTIHKTQIDRLRILAIAFAFVLAAGRAEAQAPPVPDPTPTPTPALAITGQLTVPENTICEVSLTGGSATCAWLVLPPQQTMICGQTMGFAAPPGTYTVICMAVSGGQPIILQATATVQGTPVPTPAPSPAPPTPAPGPTPSPTPAPVTGPLWAIAVYDTTVQQSLPGGQLGIWTSQTLGPNLKTMNVTLRRADKSNPVFSVPKWQTNLASATYPWMVVMDKAGNVLSSGPLPPTEAAVMSLITGIQQPAPHSRVEEPEKPGRAA